MPPHIVQQWYLAHHRALANYLVKYTRLQRADAEDVLVNVWIRVLRLVDESDVKMPLPFLQRIAFNEAQEFCSRSRQRLWHQALDEFERMEEGLGRMPSQMIEYRDGYDFSMESERIESVVNAVNSLPVRQCQAIVLHHLEGLTYKQVAIESGLSTRQVMRSLARAHSALRMQLEPSSERDHRCERAHSEPAPSNATCHAKGLQQKQDDGRDKQQEIEGSHALKRLSPSRVPGEIVT